MTRHLPAALFADAPRFHDGMGPDEFPAIYRTGERVLSPPQNEQYEAMLATIGAAPPAVTDQPIVVNQTFHLPGVVDRGTADHFKRSVSQELARSVRDGFRAHARNN